MSVPSPGAVPRYVAANTSLFIPPALTAFRCSRNIQQGSATIRCCQHVIVYTAGTYCVSLPTKYSTGQCHVTLLPTRHCLYHRHLLRFVADEIFNRAVPRYVAANTSLFIPPALLRFVADEIFNRAVPR
ncbi:hypothetical protein J6590_062529 [Homalodisca vitripennis]|nr:hypothetical protein J6590_062529 [Homalodisca vitripennis]